MVEKQYLDKSKFDGKKDVAVVLLRGMVRMSAELKATLNMLHLYRRNYCTIVKNTPQNMGMVIKVTDYIAFGEIDAETHKLVDSKRAEKDAEGKTKKFYRLMPPRGGLERKGVKVHYNLGGALGYRGKKINDFLKKMI